MARLRCGNFGKASKKGFENQECELCGVEENLEHIWNCVEARKGIKKEWVEGVDRWRAKLTRWLVETLKGEIVVELCKYIKAFMQFCA